MCGICGATSLTKNIEHDINVGAMVASLHHRGPDAKGIFRSANTVLGHARLSIIDLSEAGAQPMKSDDGRYVISYNGEVYNFPELKTQLEAQGIAFRSRSDTEVVLRAFEKWGPAAFPKLNGMFALAIWDTVNRTLFLARDRFGIKPLYYALVDGTLYFASEIKALRAAQIELGPMHLPALAEYLWFGNTTDANCLQQNVKRLAPATYLEFSGGELSFVRYWNPPRTNSHPGAFLETVAEVDRLLAAAVKRHLIADVSVGVLLSGGLDSSLITAYCANSATQVSTFSMSFEGAEDASELPLARKIATQFSTLHHEVHVGTDALWETMERLVHHHDDPFADAANIPLFLATGKIRSDAKVVLQGDGGDELFGGYARYRLARLWTLAHLLSRTAGMVLPHPTADGAYARAYRIIQACSQGSISKAFALLLTVEQPFLPPSQVLSRDMREMIELENGFRTYDRIVGELNERDVANLLMKTDTQILLPNTFLEKVDKSTMAQSVEVRVPMLDADLAEFVMALPSSQKVSMHSSKRMLRAIAARILPAGIATAPKRGFGVPYEHWLRTALFEKVNSLSRDTEAATSWLIDHTVFRRLLVEHRDRKRNHGFLLWKTINLLMWLRQNGAFRH